MGGGDGSLVDGDEPGLRAGFAGQLGGQAGDGRVEQAVQAGGRDLGGVGERRGQVIAVRGQVDPVEPGRPDELAVQVRR